LLFLAGDLNQIKYLMTKLPVLAEHFHVHRKIGEGTFSSVFLGTVKTIDADNKHVARQFAIKHLVPTTLPSRTERELQCLQDIGYVILMHRCLNLFDLFIFKAYLL
jgi:cell division control protein 7